MFRRLRHRFRTRRPYRIFTTDYDQEIRAGDLLAEIERSGHCRPPGYRPHEADALREALGRMLVVGMPSELALGGADRVVLLIDHSGSMKGVPIAVARVVAEELAGFFDGHGVPCEILGYTTRNWRGGRARERWIESGRLRRPGRLCDLRHLIYRSFADDSDWRDGLRLMSADILREGVDGEAVEWAAARMPPDFSPGRRVIIHLGDGSPIDESTLQANGMWVLEDHFVEAVKSVRQEGIQYVLLTFRLWDADIPQIPLDRDEVKCAAAVGEAIRALFPVASGMSELDGPAGSAPNA